MADLHKKTKVSMNESVAATPGDPSRGARTAMEEMSGHSRAAPDPEVAAIAKRRQFSSREKRPSWPRRIAATKPARSGRCCAAKASIHRNWQRGVGSARPPNAWRWNRARAGARPIRASPKIDGWPS